MASLKEHCSECEAALGESFEPVHVWLDEFAGTAKYGMRHRRVRHHAEGIRQVEQIWGETAAQAARLHIVADLKLEGWSEKDPFPRDETDYVRMGLF